MNPTYPLACIGELIGEQARATILVYLLDGRARTAGELAFTANISAPSASAHFSKLVDGGLLAVQSSGRHRYFNLAGPEVALALEALGAIATKPHRAALNRPPKSEEMFRARSCYDHLAGRVAVELARRLEDRQVIRASGKRDYELGSEGRNWFAAFGIDVDRLPHFSPRSKAWLGEGGAFSRPDLPFRADAVACRAFRLLHNAAQVSTGKVSETSCQENAPGIS